VAPVPETYAFAMGAAAVFNPCGVALLPASLAWVGGTAVGTERVGSRIGHGFRAGVLMAVGFTAVVAVLGLIVQAVGLLLAPILHLTMVVLGLALVLGGGAVAFGWFHLPVDRWTGLNRVSGPPGKPWTLLVSGVVYGVAALSCTLPLFVAALLPAMAEGLAAFAGLVGFFGLGTATVLVVASEATLFVRDAVWRFVGRVGPWLNAGLGGVIAAAGLYLIYYWTWGPGRLLV
jgi:cytochrome c-type biogenesis protein